jgi:hypothetical protein
MCKQWASSCNNAFEVMHLGVSKCLITGREVHRPLREPNESSTG